MTSKVPRSLTFTLVGFDGERNSHEIWVGDTLDINEGAIRFVYRERGQIEVSFGGCVLSPDEPAFRALAATMFAPHRVAAA